MKTEQIKAVSKLLLSMPVELRQIADQLAQQSGRNLSSYIRSLLIRQAMDKHLITPDIIDRIIDTKV